MAAAIADSIAVEQGRGGPAIKFDDQTGGRRWPSALEYNVFRIVQEALTNARRHSGSDRVQVDLIAHVDHLRIEVRDWGVGFDLEAVPAGHFGLEGIRERAHGWRVERRSRAAPEAVLAFWWKSLCRPNQSRRHPVWTRCPEMGNGWRQAPWGRATLGAPSGSSRAMFRMWKLARGLSVSTESAGVRQVDLHPCNRQSLAVLRTRQGLRRAALNLSSKNTSVSSRALSKGCRYGN